MHQMPELCKIFTAFGAAGVSKLRARLANSSSSGGGESGGGKGAKIEETPAEEKLIQG